MGLAGQGSRADQRGYAMAALLVGLSVMSIMMAAAMPVWSHATRREREEELIWRGEQYRRAIMLFQRKYANTFPPTLDILVDQKFLRRKYKDPITNDDFQIIPVGAAIPGGAGLPGGAGIPGAGAGQSGRPGTGGTNSGFGAQSGFGNSGASGFGNQGGVGTPAGGGGQSGFGGGGFGNQSGFGNQGGLGNQSGFGGQSGFGAQTSQSQGGLGSPGTVGGGQPGTQPAMGIQGVTSKSKAQSIRRYNNMDHYNQWAFVALAAAGQAGVGGQQFNRPGMGGGGFGRPGVGQQPGSTGQPGSGFGQPGGFGSPGGGFGQPGGMGQPGSQPKFPPVPGGSSPSPFKPAGPGSFGQQQPHP